MSREIPNFVEGRKLKRVSSRVFVPGNEISFSLFREDGGEYFSGSFPFFPWDVECFGSGVNEKEEGCSHPGLRGFFWGMVDKTRGNSGKYVLVYKFTYLYYIYTRVSTSMIYTRL